MSDYDHRRSTKLPSVGGGASTATPAPGKQTLVQQLAYPAPQVPDSPSAASTAPDVQAAAAHGISGSSRPLPFAGLIQRAFGRHTLDIEAHTDAAAATGARAMGAQAYATGNHVAFADAPDLHTAAHEAAHVVQQRGGVQLKGGVGEAGDPHEQHANQVADRVVAGQSAEDLLDRYAPSSGPTTAAAGSPVQRQAVGSAPGPAAGPVTPSTPPKREEAYHAPSSARDPDAPAARNAEWGHIQAAATDKHAQAALDITWIDALPTHLKESIDQGFADSVAAAATARAAKTDGGLKAIDKDFDKQEADLRAATIARLSTSDPSIKRKHGKELEQALKADPGYQVARAQLDVDRAARIEDRKRELREVADGPMAAGRREDSVANPTSKTVKRLEGQALARTNFMSWAVDVLGSTEAAKRHFLSVREVSRQPGMFLIEAAKTRFEAARADFETKHPGYTFPSTDVAQSLRGFHQARQGIGMLGHALGVAFDLLAYDNPNQKLPDTGGHYGYMLDRFGGSGDTRGRSVMTLGQGADGTISQLGRDTAAHKSTPAGDAMVERIRAQFEEMVATSERVKASMAARLPELSAARDDYFNSKETEKDLAQATKDEKNADKIADKRLKDEKFSGDDAAKTARREAIRAELTMKKEALAAELQSARDRVQRGLGEAFADWAAVINADLAAVRARQAQSDAEIAAQAKARQDLDAIDVHAVDAVGALNAFADAHQLKKRTPAPRAASYKMILKSELAAKQKPRGKNDPLSPTYLHNEIAVLRAWLDRLNDPKFVFGEGKIVSSNPASSKATAPSGSSAADSSRPGSASTTDAIPSSRPTAPAAGGTGNAAPTANGMGAGNTAAAAPGSAKHWATKMQVTNAPLMQYIEHGFIRHDDMPARPGAKDPKQVFNAEVATTLARFGFSPGATFRDTMHFDFIEGYSAAPGGRSQANMNKTKYGPSGDLAPAAVKPTPSTAKKAP